MLVTFPGKVTLPKRYYSYGHILPRNVVVATRGVRRFQDTGKTIEFRPPFQMFKEKKSVCDPFFAQT